MKTLRSLLAVVAILATIAPLSADPAYAPTAAPAAPPVAKTINVDFPGGSIDKLVALVAKIDGVSFSVVNGLDARDMAQAELPAFTLRNVNLITLHQTLYGLLRTRGYELPVTSTGDPNTLACVLMRTPQQLGMMMANGVFLSFQLSPFLGEQSVEEIVSAIRAAWELDPTHDATALRIKYHPGTSLLLVSAPPEAIALTQSVLGQLKRKPAPAKPAAETPASPPPTQP